MFKNPFKYAQGKRVRIVNKQTKEIKKLYKDSISEIEKKLRTMPKSDMSSGMTRIKMDSLRMKLKVELYNIDKQTSGIIRRNMADMVFAVQKNNGSYLNKLGFENIKSNVAFRTDVVNRITSGKLYGKDWTLSKSVWGDNVAKQAEINKIISRGIISNKNVNDIANDIVKYLNPNDKKDSAWTSEYPGVRRSIDYNAQRLARTMISHAYEESFVALTKDNPFIEAYKWITSGGDRVCPLCIDRETNDEYGLGPGVFPKDSLPLDHPNGMCTFDIVVSMTDDEIRSYVNDWYNDEGDEEMNEKITNYINSL